jgi:hypothetical protein
MISFQSSHFIVSIVRLIERGDMDLRYFFVGDDAYSGSEQMLTPFPGSHKWQSLEDTFNFHQSSTRIRIEMAFGRLVQRFGILWRPLNCKLEFVAPVVLACMILHNLCFDNKCSHDHMLSVSKRHVSTPFASVPDTLSGECEVLDQDDHYQKKDYANKVAQAKARVANKKTNTRRNKIGKRLVKDSCWRPKTNIRN